MVVIGYFWRNLVKENSVDQKLYWSKTSSLKQVVWESIVLEIGQEVAEYQNVGLPLLSNCFLM